MQGLPENPEGSDGFVFPSRGEILQKAECSAAGGAGWHSDVYP